MRSSHHVVTSGTSNSSSPPTRFPPPIPKGSGHAGHASNLARSPATCIGMYRVSSLMRKLPSKDSTLLS